MARRPLNGGRAAGGAGSASLADYFTSALMPEDSAIRPSPV